MSSTNVQTGYAIGIDIEGNDGQASANFVIPGELGLPDEVVLAFIKHMRAFAWPAGVYSAFTVTKSEQTTVTYTTQMATDPPSFT